MRRVDDLPTERGEVIIQTFLPYPDFAESARVLDRQRLGKQRVEVLQLIKATFVGGGWSHHPATLMWKGFTPALCAYGVAICDEWISRGYKDTCWDKIRHQWAAVLANTSHPDGWTKDVTSVPYVLPPWFGDPAFHAAHRSNLLRKDPVYYGQFGWQEPNDLPYVWPL